MTIYLPIAGMPVDPLLIVTLGALVGAMSGIFGVGGGFMLTPLLFFVGIPPGVAVSTQAAQIVASSLSGALAYWRRQAVDLRMGLIMLAGGLAGSVGGVNLYAALSEIGQVDLIVQLFYVVFLGFIGLMMFAESLHALTSKLPRRRKRHLWIHNLPFKMKFRTSGLYISILPLFLVGMLCGVLAAIMGVGGGFIMLPAMIYLLRIPARVVVGTSLVQIMVVASFTTVLHATTNHTVDMTLAMLLILGGVIGAQLGARIGTGMRPEYMRLILASLVLVVGSKVAWDILSQPSEPYSIDVVAKS